MARLLRIVWLITIASGFCVGYLPAQDSPNAYYRYPFAIGIGYVPVSAVGEVGQRASVNEFAATALLPIPGIPSLQPLLFAGFSRFDSDTPSTPSVYPGGTLDAGASMPDFNEQDVWDNTRVFAALGLGYNERISREFEVGAEALAGISQSSYDRLVVTPGGEWYPVGDLGLLAGASARVGFNPTFNLSIQIVPAIRYLRSFGDLGVFDGLYFGLGFGASYRFGEDPDAPQAEIRAIRFGAVDMPPVFPAMQSVYVREPLARVEITNIEDEPIKDVELSFFQPGYMDAPTLSARLGELAPGETVELPILASYNGEVFFTNGTTPLNGSLTVSYESRGRPVTQTQSVAYDLLDRNALTWDDDRKVSAFITAADSAVGNYASYIRTSARNDGTHYLPDNLEFAMQTYHALHSLGLLYQPDPTSPFTAVQGDAVLVDSVSLPRDTLRDITGDCDDITVLYNSILESVGIPSGIITIPGHIYSAIDTGVAPRDFARVHPDRAMTAEIDGSLWIFVEITLIGRTGFLEAWQTGMRQWQEYDQAVELRAFHTTASAQSIYRPVGLRETDLGLQYGDPQSFLDQYRHDLERLGATIIAPIQEEAEDRPSARGWNRLGVIAAQLNQYDRARAAFSSAARLDEEDPAAPLNLGSLLFLEEEYNEALAAFRDVEERLEDDPRAAERLGLTVSINLARTLYELERYEEAASYVAAAEAIDPAEAGRYDFIAARANATDGSRASAATDVPIILFAPMEDL